MSGLHGAVEAARRLAEALHGDVELAQNRLEHVRLTQRASEAARIADALAEAATVDPYYADDAEDCADCLAPAVDAD
jgi:hypothetical protein